jgi:hypothetical protein
MTSAFDRMLHITAYARAKNPKVIVVAGGPPIRALPNYSKQFFDYCCTGDIEQLQEVAADALGKQSVAEEMLPRFDLINWLGHVGHLESSRNCNFHCSFCTLTGEGNSYLPYDLEYIRKQILLLGRRTNVLFVDNNFYGNDRGFFLARIDLLRSMWKQGHFGGWSALVTGDFFANPDNLRLARESGCQALFSGVESFSATALRNFNKLQNLCLPQIEMIRSCLEAGIVFLYGVIFDVSTRSLAEIREEISLIVGTPEITLPSFMNLAIPILGTPFFHDSLAAGAILPNTKLRDLDGNTVALRPLDPIDEVVRFLVELPNLQGYRARVMRHSMGFFARYHRLLSWPQLVGALGNAALLCLPALAHNPFGRRRSDGVKRTYVSTTEAAGPLYQPRFPIAARYRGHFVPTMVTDSAGHLAAPLAVDLGARRQFRQVGHLAAVRTPPEKAAR